MTKTGVPTLTCSNSHSASGTYIRMHPCEAEYPIDAGSGVPWMPTPAAESPIQRVPSGFPRPGGTGFSPFAHSDVVGGYHHGSRCIVTMLHCPVGVGYCACPVATRKLRTSDVPS